MKADARRARFYRPPRPCDVGWVRIATAFLRRPPDFLIIGAQRGGTTSLYEYLNQHPGVASATEKEIHFFDFQRARGSRWYRAHFPWKGRRITGEATPFYLYHPRSPAAVKAMLPKVRLIVMLRDPIERAHSHYRLERQAKIEPLATFEEALNQEAERLQGELERTAEQEDYYSYALQHYSYQSRGLYRSQLERWHQHFGREQMLIFPSETFYSQPACVFDRVCDFLGLPSSPQARGNPPNLNHAAGETMAPETRRRLAEYFTVPNRELAEYLGETLPWPAAKSPTA